MRYLYSLKSRALVLASREQGQDGIEYALVAAVAVVAVVGALATGFPGQVITHAIAAVDAAIG